MADAGRDGGPIGLFTIGLSGEKKPDLLLSVEGVTGSWKMLSMVRSEREGLEVLRGLGVST